jgi:hypothetical protein
MTELHDWQEENLDEIRKEFDIGAGPLLTVRPGWGKTIATDTVEPRGFILTLPAGVTVLRMGGRGVDVGTQWHAVRSGRGESLCGKIPGLASAGWQSADGALVTCRVCARRAINLARKKQP